MHESAFGNHRTKQYILSWLTIVLVSLINLSLNKLSTVPASRERYLILWAIYSNHVGDRLDIFQSIMLSFCNLKKDRYYSNDLFTFWPCIQTVCNRQAIRMDMKYLKTAVNVERHFFIDNVYWQQLLRSAFKRQFVSHYSEHFSFMGKDTYILQANCMHDSQIITLSFKYRQAYNFSIYDLAYT